MDVVGSTRSIVTATLRQLAEQVPFTRDELREIADQVERDDDDDICPICEEATCDEDCPLAEARSQV